MTDIMLKMMDVAEEYELTDRALGQLDALLNSESVKDRKLTLRLADALRTRLSEIKLPQTKKR